MAAAMLTLPTYVSLKDELTTGLAKVDALIAANTASAKTLDNLRADLFRA